jgi:hypothetical protein
VTEEENQAAAFVKLHEDVRALVVKAVIEELAMNPFGALSGMLKTLVSQEMPAHLQTHMQNYRIVQRGNTASY